MEAERNKATDAVKGAACILVIIGHCIQFGFGLEYYSSGEYWNNILFKIIYTFHMPLFAMVSGYFSFYSVSKYTTGKLVAEKLKQLLVPILAWSCVPFGISVVKTWVSGKKTGNIFLGYFSIARTQLWFLWALLFCFAILILVNKIFQDKLYIYLAIWVVLLLTPDSFYDVHLYKFLYPYFVGAYLFNKLRMEGKIKIHLSGCKLAVSLCTLILGYVVMLQLYHKDVYIYTSKLSIISDTWSRQLYIDMLRWIEGLSGSLIFLMGMLFWDRTDRLCRIKRFLTKMGGGIHGIVHNKQLLLPVCCDSFNV